MVSRFPIDSLLDDFPTPPPKGKRGPKPKKGVLMGSAKTLINQSGWQAQPREHGAEILVKEGLWHSVLPQVPIKVVFIRRLNRDKEAAGPRYLEALFSTDLSLSAQAILDTYASRWGVEITLRESYALYGLAQDACRKYPRLVAINSLRLIFAAAQVFWFINSCQRRGRPQLLSYRPWYRQKHHPSLTDVKLASQEDLFAHGIIPTSGFWAYPLLFQRHSLSRFRQAA